MDRTITDLFHSLPDRGLPTRQSSELMPFAQDDTFFRMAVHKSNRVRALRAHFKANGIRRVFVTSRMHSADLSHLGIEVQRLELGWFQDASEDSRAAKRALIDDAVVFVNNNDVGGTRGESHHAEFFSSCTRTAFVGWDWDNHHWLEVSTYLAAHSDLYCPAHHENLYLLTRCNWLTAGPVYCGSLQWPRRFLADRLPDMLRAERSASPLGKHVPYNAFSFRNRVIATLGGHYPGIGFSDPTFHKRTPEDRLAEWIAHKVHWITPVLNDVPIRLFDALITGGIPIVPESLRHLPPVAAIPREDIVFYRPDHVVAPAEVVDQANALFDRGGSDGMARRHRLAMTEHHGDSRLHQMLLRLADQFEAPIGRGVPA